MCVMRRIGCMEVPFSAVWIKPVIASPVLAGRGAPELVPIRRPTWRKRTVVSGRACLAFGVVNQEPCFADEVIVVIVDSEIVNCLLMLDRGNRGDLAPLAVDGE